MNAKTVTTDLDTLPDFTDMTPAQEAAFWERHDVAPDVFETGEAVENELDVLLGITSADKH